MKTVRKRWRMKAEWRTDNKTQTNDLPLMWSSLLLVNCGSAGAFSHSAPFIRSPCSSSSSPLLSPNPPPNHPSCAHTETLRHTPSWYQSNQSQWKLIIVLCHGNAPSCWNGVGWECTSRANITTVRFPHVEIWSVRGPGGAQLSLQRLLA